ncbi:DUF3846 domain-containing protein [Parafrigoribacterium humi]|uniref:DUF3846 domain-containing protein n=1 Tax=Parafrigoribacterium humi TaxID=3144664 RepID=UPI0032EE484F
MVTGIVIPHETRLALQKVEFQNLTDYQTAVGGYIETVKMDGHPLVIVADEDGKMKQLPVNRRATCLWWLLTPGSLGGDFLVGDVVILGEYHQGRMNDVPEKLTALLLETSSYEVQACLSKQFNTWVRIGKTYADFFEAARNALTLMEVWEPPGEVKVVAVN